jgi:hypothetical protein
VVFDNHDDRPVWNLICASEASKQMIIQHGWRCCWQICGTAKTLPPQTHSRQSITTMKTCLRTKNHISTDDDGGKQRSLTTRQKQFGTR